MNFRFETQKVEKITDAQELKEAYCNA